MGTYSGAWRSNKFRVKDPIEFAVWADEWDALSHRVYKDNMVSLSDIGDCYGLPNSKMIEAKDGSTTYLDEGLNFITELADHVDETAVAIIIHSGFDDRRTVEGYAYAITGGDAALPDRIVELSLFDIEDIAKRKFGKKPLPFNEKP